MQRRDDRQQSQREPVGQGQVALPDEPREGSSAHAILESELDHQRSGNGLTTDAQQSSTNPSSMASTTPTEDRSPSHAAAAALHTPLIGPSASLSAAPTEGIQGPYNAPDHLLLAHAADAHAQPMRVGAGTHLCRNIFLVVLDHTMPIFCNFSFI